MANNSIPQTQPQPQPQPKVMFVFNSWDKHRCGLPGFHRHLVREFCRRKGEALKVYSTVVDTNISEDQMKDARDAGVTLMKATRKELIKPSEDPPDIKWLLNHESYYPELSQLKNVQYVVGYAPKTARAALEIQQRLFPNAQLYFINHLRPDDPYLISIVSKDELEKEMFDMADKAHGLVSIGPSMKNFFDNSYRALTSEQHQLEVNHIEVLPTPSHCFFQQNLQLQQDLQEHTLLTYGDTDTIDFVPKYEDIPAAVGEVMTARKKINLEPPRWTLLGESKDQDNLLKTLKEKMNSPSTTPTLYHNYSTGKLMRHLSQSHLCLPTPHYQEYGFCGLEAMAAGLPFRIPDDSQIGAFVSRYFEDYCDDCLTKSNKWTEGIQSILGYTIAAFKLAKNQQKTFLESKDVSDGHRKFAAMFPDRDGKCDKCNTSSGLNVRVALKEAAYEERVNQCEKKSQDQRDDHDVSYWTTMKQTLKTVWDKCTQLFNSNSDKIVTDTSSRDSIDEVCTKCCKDKVCVSDMRTGSLNMTLNFPHLPSLYRFEGCCRSGSLVTSLEPLLITDEMRQLAAEVDLPLQLHLTYDNDEFYEVGEFFLDRDGGSREKTVLHDDIDEESDEEIEIDINIDETSCSPGQELHSQHLEDIVGHSKVSLEEQKVLQYRLDDALAEKRQLEERCKQYLERVDSAERVVVKQLFDIHSLRAELEKSDIKAMTELEMKLQANQTLVIELETKLSAYQHDSEEHIAKGEIGDILVGDEGMKEVETLVHSKQHTPPEKEGLSQPISTSGMEYPDIGKGEILTGESSVTDKPVKADKEMSDEPRESESQVVRPKMPTSVKSAAKDEIKTGKERQSMTGKHGEGESTVLGQAVITIIPKEKPSILQRSRQRLGLQSTDWSVKRIGRRGKGPAEFNNPRGMAMTPTDLLLVCDWRNQRIQILNKEFQCLDCITFTDEFPQPFKPWDIAVSYDNQYFINDKGNKQIIVTNQNKKIIRIICQNEVLSGITVMGNFVLATDWHGARLIKFTTMGDKVTEVKGQVQSKGQFSSPRSVAVTSDQKVVMSHNKGIHFYDSNLKFISSYDHSFNAAGLCVDKRNNIYICDWGNNRVVMVTENREFVVVHSDIVNPYFIEIRDEKTTKIFITQNDYGYYYDYITVLTL
ncbi:uncharacterized protein LOC144440056 isoform X2 [Glandiceps talaboti]